MELAVSRLLAGFASMADNAAQPVAQVDIVLAVPSPPVMFWICGEDSKYCSDAHGYNAEYRSR